MMYGFRFGIAKCEHKDPTLTILPRVFIGNPVLGTSVSMLHTQTTQQRGLSGIEMVAGQ